MSPILLPADKLVAGGQYAFTYDSGKIFEDSASWVQGQLEALIPQFGLGEIISVTRGFLSSHYVIAVMASGDFLIADWQSAFAYCFDQMGWESPVFIQCETGQRSSQPGGIRQEVVQDVTGIMDTASSAVSGGLGATLKNLWPYLALAGVGVVLYMYAKGRLEGKKS